MGIRAHGIGQRGPQTPSQMLQEEEREAMFEDMVSESFPEQQRHPGTSLSPKKGKEKEGHRQAQQSKTETERKFRGWGGQAENKEMYIRRGNDNNEC